MPDGSLNIHYQTWEILTFQKFKDWFDECPHQRTLAWGKIDGLRERLEASSEAIKDPIAFLNDLYFDQEYSLRRILDHPVVNQFYSIKWFRNLLVNSFGWELREKTQKTPEHQRLLDERFQWQINDFSDAVNRLLHWREKVRVFRMEEFKKKKHRVGKVLYLLKTLWGIDKKVLYRLSSEWGLENIVIARWMNEQVKLILWEYPDLPISFEEIKLRAQSIDRWFDYVKEHWGFKDE